MVKEDIWQRADNLTDRIFQVTSGLDLPHGDLWHTVVTVFLTQTNERMDSIRVLLHKNHLESAVIVTRALYELTVNLAYLAKDVPTNLKQYLQHGGIPTTPEEADKLRAEIDRDDQPDVTDIVPGQAWKPLGEMCRELGSDWLQEYRTFYRYASVPTHAGSFTLGKNYEQLLEQQPPTGQEKATILVTAMDFHLRVPEIAAELFPHNIKPEAIKRLKESCKEIGVSL